MGRVWGSKFISLVVAGMLVMLCLHPVASYMTTCDYLENWESPSYMSGAMQAQKQVRSGREWSYYYCSEDEIFRIWTCL